MTKDTPSLLEKTESLSRMEELFKQGERKDKQLTGRLTARQRLEILLDRTDNFLELGIWAGFNLYPEAPSFPCAGVITGIASVTGRHCMVIANDPHVYEGALFPQSVKKILRAQKIALLCKLPILYLLDTCGIYTQRQDESFPDEDDLGRIVRNSAVIAHAKIPQIAAIMGLCSSSTSYIPALCNTVIMTEASSLFMTNPSTVKAAIGQLVENEELGGARMHAEISGTVDFLEKDDRSCLMRVRSQMELLPQDPPYTQKLSSFEVEYYPYNIYEIADMKGKKPFDTHDLISCIIDRGSLQEYKSFYGNSLITGYAKINGFAIGIVANQRLIKKSSNQIKEYESVLYAESAEKAASFVLSCNQMRLPLLFLQDIDSIAMGREAEKSGILKSSAKMIDAISNCTVPKITVITGNSFGPGAYALCGKAFDPCFIFAWPNTRFSSTNLVCIPESEANAFGSVSTRIDFSDATYGASRGWVDAIIAPHKTREVLTDALTYISRKPFTDRNFYNGAI